MFLTDPLHTSLLASRRLPKRLRSTAVRGIRTTGCILPGKSTVASALADFISDNPQDAREKLSATRNSGIIRDALCVALDITDTPLRRQSKARQLWRLGDWEAALELAQGRLRQHITDERETITHGIDRIAALPRSSGTIPSSKPTGVIYSLTNSLPSSTAGYAQRSHQLLKAVTQQGIDVTASTRPGYPVIIGKLASNEAFCLNGVMYRRNMPWIMPTKVSQKIRLEADRIVELARRNNAGVLHCTTDWVHGLATFEAARRTGLPWIYEMRGQREDTWLTQFPDSLIPRCETSSRYKSLRRIETQLATAANAVIVLSEVQKKELVERGVDNRKVAVVPNGVEETLINHPRDKATSRQSLSLPTDGFIYGTVSSVVAYEGIDLLVRILPRVLEEVPTAHLVIVGDGSALPSLRKMADQLRVHEHITFAGAVPYEETPSWYASFDVFCIPRIDSRVTQTITPLKSIPALACGVPVLASNLSALREITPPTERQWLLPPDNDSVWSDRLTTMAVEPLSESTSQICRAFAQLRIWKQSSRALTEIYEQLGHMEVL
nr:glycosyltransferase [Corynebacterium mendelii]